MIALDSDQHFGGRSVLEDRSPLGQGGGHNKFRVSLDGIQNGLGKTAQVAQFASDTLSGARAAYRGQGESQRGLTVDPSVSGNSGGGGYSSAPEAGPSTGGLSSAPPSNPMQRRSLDSFDDEELLDLYIREFIDGEDSSEMYARSFYAEDMVDGE